VGRPSASARPVPRHPQATTVDVRAELLQADCLQTALDANVELVMWAIDRSHRDPATDLNSILLNGIIAPELPEPSERFRATLLAECKKET
jgi:hypothetical protein